MRSRWLRLFAAAAVIGLAGVPATRGQTSSPTKVSMKEFAYMPDTVTVMGGEDWEMWIDALESVDVHALRVVDDDVANSAEALLDDLHPSVP